MDIKTLWISDVHLGSAHANTQDLLEFLDKVKDESPPEKIYIVGDFIDGWKLKRNWYWTDQSSLVIRKILGFLKKQTNIYIVAGNHDEFLRDFIEDFKLFDFGSIHLGNEFIHESVNGKKYLVVHGDMFDMVAQYAKWLCWLGDLSYEIMLSMNYYINKFRKSFKLKKWSLAKVIKKNVKKAVNYISDFENCLTAYAKEKDCEGCICGHIHTADLKAKDDFVYANTGDWVESCTAIYEDSLGNLHLYNHNDD